MVPPFGLVFTVSLISSINRRVMYYDPVNSLTLTDGKRGSYPENMISVEALVPMKRTAEVAPKCL